MSVKDKVRVLIIVLFYCLETVKLQGTGSGNDGNLRLCIVEGRGAFKRAPLYCPVLDKAKAGVECVLGTDRLDCLRRISKGTVDFGVFSPEDLVAAQWANIDVLVTNELRLRERPYARSIVAVINKRILPDNSFSTNLNTILKNTTLCHPGEVLNDIRPLSEALSEYLESLILPQSCEPDLSFTENKLKALSDFYGGACKAGLWLPDKTRDVELKKKFPSLCAACHSRACSASDRYFGNSGALNCLYDGAGDVTWGEADDVAAYFQLHNSEPLSGVHNLAYLCRDGTWRELGEEPCVWLHRPWNVVVAKRKASVAVAKLMSTVSASVPVDNSWLSALTAVLEWGSAASEPLQPPQAPLDYLATASGFREAYSRPGCSPPRHITLCTTSLVAKNKCEWLSEAGAVYGIAPPLQCAMRADTNDCLKAVESGEIHATVADSDWLVTGIRDYNLTPVLHEITPIVEKTNTIVAYVRRGSDINKMTDLRGKKAAFPRFDGFAWHSVLNYLSKHEKISCGQFLEGYFEEVCAPGLEGKKCYEEGEVPALKSLIEGKSDVAFISMTTFNKFKNDYGNETHTMDNIVPLCPEGNQKYCFISWSNLGHIFAAKNLSATRRHEIVNLFTKLDQIFGKHPPFHNAMFSMYGTFNHETEVIFHTNTKNIATEAILKTHPYDKIPYNFELSISNVTNFSCDSSFGAKTVPYIVLYLVSLVVFVINS